MGGNRSSEGQPWIVSPRPVLSSKRISVKGEESQLIPCSQWCVTGAAAAGPGGARRQLQVPKGKVSPTAWVAGFLRRLGQEPGGGKRVQNEAARAGEQLSELKGHREGRSQDWTGAVSRRSEPPALEAAILLEGFGLHRHGWRCLGKCCRYPEGEQAPCRNRVPSASAGR